MRWVALAVAILLAALVVPVKAVSFALSYILLLLRHRVLLRWPKASDYLRKNNTDSSDSFRLCIGMFSH